MIDSGLVHYPRDREFPIADPTFEPDGGHPFPPIETSCKGLSNVVTIRQGNQAVYISTRRIRRLIDDLENYDTGEDQG